MLKSMTGFGTSSLETENASIVVEIRSINSKSQDFSFRLPRSFQDKELEVKNLLTTILDRGKVSMSLDFVRKGSIKPKLTINPELFKAYYEDLKKNATVVGASNTEILKIVAGLPEVFDVDKSDTDLAHEWENVLLVIKESIVKCEEFRKSEGAILEKQLSSYIQKIAENLDKISTQDPIRIQKIREKLSQKVEEFILNGKIDGMRFEQELIYYIEKLDMTEEKVRLKTHLDYFIETMSKDDANGKKLGFISQEIGREINTIGSKANDAQIQKWVVEMKEELEKIKEQSLNVL